ncbi:MAG: hypothetical protein ACK54T_10665 [bacterium]
MKLPWRSRTTGPGLRGWQLRPEAVISACALLAPVLAVQMVRLIPGTHGPRQASALTPPTDGTDGTDAGTNPLMPALPNLSPTQTLALQWGKEQLQTPIVGNPLLRPKPQAKTTPGSPTLVPNPATNPAEPELPQEVKALKMTSIMRLGGELVVTINGRAYRVGEPVLPGWFLTELALPTRQATLKNQAGLTARLQQSK